MRLFIDGTEVPCPCGTLGGALDAARTNAGGRLIVEARADGFEVSPTDLEEPPARAPYAGTLEITTQDAGEVVRSLLRDAAGALDTVSPAHAQAATQINSGNVEQALATLGEVLRTWSSVRTAMELVWRAGPVAGYDVREQGGDLAPVLAGLADRLTEIKRSLGTSDWSGLADVLAYDMDEQARVCRRWLVAAQGQNAAA